MADKTANFFFAAGSRGGRVLVDLGEITGVIAVNVQTGSAKISAAMPDDEDEDYDIPIWAGVLPLESRFTRLLDDDRLLDGVESSPAVRALQDRQV